MKDGEMIRPMKDIRKKENFKQQQQHHQEQLQ